MDAEITVPGDKSISHRAAIIAALSNGACRLDGFLAADDCMRTVEALRALGIRIDEPEPNTIVVHGKKRALNPPEEETPIEEVAPEPSPLCVTYVRS